MTSLSARLSAHDSVFLHWERTGQSMHVTECMSYGGRITADHLIEMIQIEDRKGLILDLDATT